MNNDVDSVIEQHQKELQKVSDELRLLTRNISHLDETVSSLQSLKYDMFVSHEISTIEIPEDSQSYRLYEGVNHSYDALRKQFEEFKSKQYDIECLYTLNNNEFFNK